ncbi:DUF6087 family protein [Streptomyces goshikiensis]|uniref:DUF6087 family protein n=1 Tax=Streptomyces goshikiensis TaxID=1942 RepID=UPI0037B8284E
MSAPGTSHTRPLTCDFKLTEAQWTTLATVPDLAAARRFLNPQTADEALPPPPAPSPMAAGTGRHRKPRAD